MSFLRGVRGLLRSPPSTVRARLSAQPAVMLRPVRAFHVSIRTASQVIADQDPETGLYYHEIDNGTYAVSFLKRPPKNPTSIAVIAHVTSANNSPDEQLRHSPDKVWINPAFFDALHHVLKANVADDETLMVEANLRKNGFAHLCDSRGTTMPDRVPATDSIFASVGFTDAKIAPESYERNNMYRFSVRTQGPMRIPERWLRLMRDYIQKNE